MSQKFEIVPQHLFRVEAGKIIPIFGSQLVAVHQLSSLALPKPEIDMWVEVADIEKIVNIDWLAEAGESEIVIDEFTQKLIELGYMPRGEQGLAGRRFFSKDSDPTAAYRVHVYQFGHYQPGLQQQNNTAEGIYVLRLTRSRLAETFIPQPVSTMPEMSDLW